MLMMNPVKPRQRRYNRAFVRQVAGEGLKLLKRPFETPFARQLRQIERIDGDGGLEGLRGFDELYASAWLGLEKIGYEVVRHFRPKVVVELGTHMGLSALAMGLALHENAEGGRLFAVDTWEGETHAGIYDDSVYQTFMGRRASLGLDETIVPLRMFFDEARSVVPTPVDLLHIDGLHTLDAVTHDWETFSPLVRPGGLVMFHDVNSPWRDVAAFWKGLTKRYDTSTVFHSNGLGILQMPPR